MDRNERRTTPEVGLFEALAVASDVGEIENFLKDLCTPREIREMTERWRVCQLLHSGDRNYHEIHSLTSVSPTTIGRVARFLKDENNGGYRTILKKIQAL
jgi:TrpR-related protein YerC/YecD